MDIRVTSGSDDVGRGSYPLFIVHLDIPLQPLPVAAVRARTGASIRQFRRRETRGSCDKPRKARLRRWPWPPVCPRPAGPDCGDKKIGWRTRARPPAEGSKEWAEYKPGAGKFR